MQRIIFVSRAYAETLLPDPAWAVVSISEPSGVPASLAPDWSDVLRLEFVDADEHCEHGQLFTAGMAEDIIEFAAQAFAKGKSLVVNCHAGISRSAAVAVALGQLHDLPVFNMTVKLAPTYSLYNKYVYRLLHRAMTGY